MKLSKTSWLIIITGFFVILLVGLGIVRSQQVHQQNELNEQLALAQSKIQVIQLEQLSHRQGELERQFSETDSQSESAKRYFPSQSGALLSAISCLVLLKLIV